MSDTPAHLSERMLSEGQKTLAFFRLLTPEQWGLTIYTEGTQWAVRDVLAHFVAAESGITRLVENILSGGAGTPEDFNLNAYNERKVAGLKGVPTEELLAQFASLREQSAALARGLSEEDLLKTGRHPWLGVAPIADILKMMYRHNQIHQRDIRRSTGPGERSING
jgi:DinB superfamily